jgi:hypothetical protein
LTEAAPFTAQQLKNTIFENGRRTAKANYLETRLLAADCQSSNLSFLDGEMGMANC